MKVITTAELSEKLGNPEIKIIDIRQVDTHNGSSYVSGDYGVMVA